MPDQILLEHKAAILKTTDGTQYTMELREFFKAMATQTVQGRSPTPIADNVRWVVSCSAARFSLWSCVPNCDVWNGSSTTAPCRSGPRL